MSTPYTLDLGPYFTCQTCCSRLPISHWDESEINTKHISQSVRKTILQGKLSALALTPLNYYAPLWHPPWMLCVLLTWLSDTIKAWLILGMNLLSWTWYFFDTSRGRYYIWTSQVSYILSLVEKMIGRIERNNESTILRNESNLHILHDDVIKWKLFPRYWPFVWGIHRWPVHSPHKGQWRGGLKFSLICALNKRLSEQSRSWWFETPSCSLWRHCIDIPLQASTTILYCRGRME